MYPPQFPLTPNPRYRKTVYLTPHQVEAIIIDYLRRGKEYSVEALADPYVYYRIAPRWESDGNLGLINQGNELKGVLVTMTSSNPFSPHTVEQPDTQPRKNQ